MYSTLFNHVNLLGKSLDAAWVRNEVTMQNIANAETPGYKSYRVDFEQEFARALSGGDSLLDNKKTRDKHIDFGGKGTNPLSVSPTVSSNEHYSMRMDENNVDVDNEMLVLAQNTIMYNSLVTQISSEMNRLNTVARDGR